MVKAFLFILLVLVVVASILVIPSYAAKSKIAQLDLSKLNQTGIDFDDTTVTKPTIQNVTITTKNITKTCPDDNNLLCRFNANGTTTAFSRCYSLGFVGFQSVEYDSCVKVNNSIDYYTGFMDACQQERGIAYRQCESMFISQSTDQEQPKEKEKESLYLYNEEDSVMGDE